MSEPPADPDKAVVHMTVLASDPDTAWFTCIAVKLPTKVAVQIVKLMEDGRAAMLQSH